MVLTTYHSFRNDSEGFIVSIVISKQYRNNMIRLEWIQEAYAIPVSNINKFKSDDFLWMSVSLKLKTAQT